MKDIAGGVTSPAGFKAGTAECGIKSHGRPDLAVIASGVDAVCAGVFTTNRIKGAPVIVSRENVRNGKGRAIIANSGNANVCNGEDGIEAALAMTSLTARLLKCDPSDVFVASTGVIGKPFPLDKVKKGIPVAIGNLSVDGNADVARAIMTTDTVPKETAIELEIGDTMVKIGAIAKGSGMIRPDMATMFCFITTDADIDAPALRKALRQAVDESFNCISVDGDMSTSDTVIALANGKAGNQTIHGRSKAFDAFTNGLTEVCTRMAQAIVRDGEGMTRFITLHINGAAGKEDARKVGFAIANSPLVKTAFFGCDPNWGRIICAAGYSGVPVEESNITITINDIVLFERGKIYSFDERKLRDSLASKDIDVVVDLGMGQTDTTLFTTDMSYEYIKINAEYTS